MIGNPFRRGTPVPSEVAATASLGAGEKVLAGAPAEGDVWLLGTHKALHVVGSAKDVRIPWERIERADWNRDEEQLVVAEVGEFGSVRPTYTFRLSDPGLLLELVRERVTASVVVQRRVRVAGRRGLVVVGRRAPGSDQEVAWAYQLDPGVDPEDPTVMAAAEDGLRAARAEIGL